MGSPAPTRQIAANAGYQPGAVAERVTCDRDAVGFDAATGDHVDLSETGVIDPFTITRAALQNPASVAALVLTTERLIADRATTPS